uniref:Uncharacterized protein n=1 Tax=Setaria viridis TaxID=4556 RepID=A0A4U6UKH4_SETVI|nr:hypothetical protein SEVIR_5G248250v2 [Setaria viridis]
MYVRLRVAFPCLCASFLPSPVAPPISPSLALCSATFSPPPIHPLLPPRRALQAAAAVSQLQITILSVAAETALCRATPIKPNTIISIASGIMAVPFPLISGSCKVTRIEGRRHRSIRNVGRDIMLDFAGLASQNHGAMAILKNNCGVHVVGWRLGTVFAGAHKWAVNLSYSWRLLFRLHKLERE